MTILFVLVYFLVCSFVIDDSFCVCRWILEVEKKRRVVGLCFEDDFVDLEDSQSDDVMCSQYVNDDSFGDKSSSDVEMLSEVSFFYLFSCILLFYIF